MTDKLKDKSPSPMVRYFKPGLYNYSGGPLHYSRDTAPLLFVFFYSYISKCFFILKSSNMGN